MADGAQKRRLIVSGMFIAALCLSCGALGFLQYRWIGQISVAEHDRLRAALDVNLARLSADFNNEVESGLRALLPAGPVDAESAERTVEARYDQWKRAGHGQAVRRLAIAVPHDGSATLRVFDWEQGHFENADWPADWAPIQRRIEARLTPGGGRMIDQNWRDPQGLAFEIPLFRQPGPPREARQGRERRFEMGFGRRAPRRDGPGETFGRMELGWVVFDLNLPYIRSVILPEVLQRYLATAGVLDYDIEVVDRFQPDSIIYASDPETRRLAKADAAITLLDLGDLTFRGGRGGRGGRGPGAPGGPGAAGPGFGRWELFVRHRAGSLEAVVARTRMRNLLVTGAILLLLVATLVALLRVTRDAQRLAQRQMDFVAAVSHELRTPLTALYTAGHNLRGRVAQQPPQVVRYGEMIQHEAGRLKDLVEQVLRFASSEAGRAIQDPHRVSLNSVIEGSVESTRPVIQAAHCELETRIDPELPPVMGDPVALQHALQNLLTNAVKYGAGERHWVSITATTVNGGGPRGVEIRVADHGPGIPQDEQEHIFDAFYRGRRATHDQIHGTGLGLNLVKRIVEAHGGAIRVKSAPGEGAEFILRLPAAPDGIAA